MNDKYAKEIAKELKLIRCELQKGNREQEDSIIKEFKLAEKE